jgi:hypothetical protein
MTVETAGKQGIERRALLRGGVLLGLGVTAVAAALALESGTAYAANSQPNWAWCNECQQVWYKPQGFGLCPAYNNVAWPHALKGKYTSDNYRPEYDYSGSGWQQGWRWCKNCHSLFHGNVEDGICQYHLGSGPHDGTGSYAYALYYGDVSDGQPDWRWCKYCYTLFYGPKQEFSACSRDGGGRYTHDGSGSWAYQLPYSGTLAIVGPS